MANHADSSAGHDHAPAPKELSHPVLWAVGLFVSTGVLGTLFFHQIDAGRAHARGEPPVLVAKAGGGEPNHAALMADNGQPVLDKGELLYGKNCASCHGAKGDTNPNNTVPAPRNFRTEPLKSTLGNGPYAFYKVLSEGYGASMPAFKNLTPEERYAVVHFVRETMIKPANPAYAAKDSAATQAKIPAAGSAGGAAAEVAPHQVVPPAMLPELLAAWSEEEHHQHQVVLSLLLKARTGAASTLIPALDLLDEAARRRPALVDRALVAVRTGDQAAFVAALTSDAGAGSADPRFTLMPASQLQALYARLAQVAGAGVAH